MVGERTSEEIVVGEGFNTLLLAHLKPIIYQINHKLTHGYKHVELGTVVQEEYEDRGKSLKIS